MPPLHLVCKAVGEVEYPAGGGQLGRPHDVAPDHVHGGLARLELRLYLLEVLVARGRGRPPRHLDLALVLLVETVDEGLQAPRLVRPEGEGDPDPPASALLPAAAPDERPAPEQSSPREPRPAELEEPLPADPAPPRRGASLPSLIHYPLPPLSGPCAGRRTGTRVSYIARSGSLRLRAMGSKTR